MEPDSSFLFSSSNIFNPSKNMPETNYDSVDNNSASTYNLITSNKY